MRSNLILAVIAAALAVPTSLAYLSDVAVYTDYGGDPMFPGFTGDRVNQIVLRQPKPAAQTLPGLGPVPGPAEVQFDRLAFQKRGGRWVVAEGELAGAPVSDQVIDVRIFQHMERVQATPEPGLEDASEDVLRESLLTPDTAFAISCQFVSQLAGQQPTVDFLAELLVGREVSGGSVAQEAVRGFLVAKSKTDDVVLYEAPFWERSLDPTEWVDPEVHNVNQGIVRRFSLNNAETDEPVVFELRPGSDSTWMAVEKPEGVGAVRQGEVITMVSRYRRMIGISLIGPAATQNLAALGLEPAVMELQATMDDGSVVGIKIGNKYGDRNEYYAMSTGLDFVRTVPEWAVTNFQMDPKEALFDPPAAVIKEADKDPDPEPTKKDGK